ncbi:alkaline phosphatase family protein, partial [Nonomuraea angiospora]|nr:alkaline phosphatase family protein [Nonomuraea angiospora]
MAPLVVINVVGLTPRLLAHMPNVAKVGTAAALRPVLPAVTCSMQATLLTGA